MGVSNGRGTSFTAGTVFRDGVSNSAGVVQIVDIQRLFYDPNGDFDYITIPTVNLTSGDVIKLTLVGKQPPPTGQDDVIILGVDLFLLNKVAGGLLFAGCTVKVDGVSVNSNSFMMVDFVIYEIECTITTATNFGFILGDGTQDGVRFQRPVFNVDVSAASGNRFYPIDDGFDNDPTIRDTVAGQDGTAVSFEESGWIENLPTS